MKGFLSLIVAVSVLFVGSYVMAGSPGSKGAVFLKLGQGARANAMGESFVAVADDINALYWNPAGIAQIKERQATFMYSDWLEEIKYNYLAYIHPTQIMGGIMGGAVTLLDSGSIDKYGDDPDGVGPLKPPKLGTFDGKDIAVSVSYAKEMMPNCSLGATVKYIQMKIDGKKSTGFGLDVGCLYKPKVENLTLGAVVQNFGPKLGAFVSEKDSLPLNFKVGGAYKLLDKALTLALDINFPSDNDTNFNLGGEYWIKEMVAIRAGYKTLTKDALKSSDLTFGAGFKMPGTGFGLDYAYCDYDDLGDTHRVSLMTKF
ncbi:MAG: PorV/PorQ family protein [Nitrospirota bacterium]